MERAMALLDKGFPYNLKPKSPFPVGLRQGNLSQLKTVTA
jgi:hypothetical protein